MADGGRATGPKDRRRGILRIGSDGVLPGADCCSDPAVNAVTQTLEATARQAAGEVDRRVNRVMARAWPWPLVCPLWVWAAMPEVRCEFPRSSEA